MKYDVLKRKAGRRKCSQVDYLTGKKSVEVISEECQYSEGRNSSKRESI